MNNISYIISLFLFLGLTWIGFEKKKNIKKIEKERIEILLNEKEVRINAENEKLTD